MTTHQPVPQATRDLLARPWTVLFWWGLPLAAGWSADAAALPRPAETFVWAAALAWMGAGCALNAWRCGRPHCYVAAPVLILGALGAALTALGLSPWGSGAAGYVINGALGLALLSFLAECALGRHRRGGKLG